MPVTSEITTEKTVRKIYRCTNKACKHTWAFDYTARTTVTEGDGHMGYWRDSKTVLYRDGKQESRLNDNTCPQCGKLGNGGDKVKAGLTSKEKCGPRCLNAKGPDCDCQCHGASHGANHIH